MPEPIISPEAHDAVRAAYVAFERLSAAKTLPEMAAEFEALSNAMGDVATWLPGYDVDTGELGDA